MWNVSRREPKQPPPAPVASFRVPAIQVKAAKQLTNDGALLKDHASYKTGRESSSRLTGGCSAVPKVLRETRLVGCVLRVQCEESVATAKGVANRDGCCGSARTAPVQSDPRRVRRNSPASISTTLLFRRSGRSSAHL